MDRNISLAVIKRRTIEDGKFIPTPDEWRRPLVVKLGVCARFISPRQLEETSFALRIVYAVRSWINPSYIRSSLSPNYRLSSPKSLKIYNQASGSAKAE
jgi:hypothetical protein